MGYTQFPTPGTGYSQIPSAWVRIRGASFNTIPAMRATFAGRNFSPDNNFILPLQRYSAPNNINYVETEPSGLEKFGQGLRDMFTGDVSKLFSMLPDLGISNFIGGIGGASLLDVSYSDLLFKASAKRIHSFGWNLVAKNAKEASNLDKIANNMQSRMYPFLIDPYTNKIKPPEMWRIEIYPNNGGASRSRFTNSSAVLENQIQLCILQNLEVNRADQNNGPILTTDNKFLSLNITATFVEIEPVYRSWNITNVLGESKHNTLYSRSKLTSGSAMPFVGNMASQAISEGFDLIDDTFSNATVDSLPGLNNII